MSNNEIVVTLKGNSPSSPWIVIHGDNPQVVDQGLDALTGDLLAKIHGVNEIFQNVQAAAPLAPPPVSVQQPQPAAPAQPTGWQAPAVPQYQPPAAVAPTAPTAPAGDLPPGVLVWTAPNPEPGKEQYTELWFEYPFIKSPDDRAVLKAALAAAGVKPWFHSPTKKWITKTGNEAAVRSVLAQNAHLFG